VNLKIDTTSGVPIYLQIVDQVKKSVAVGSLRPEDALPSVRQLALELTINPNTVARAYLELEHQGVIYKRQGQGTYVSAQAVEVSRRDRREIVAGILEDAIVEAINSGMTPSEIGGIYDKLMHRYNVEKP
jgi:GntR family transcriptional regulator